jgi:hypothetical protein
VETTSELLFTDSARSRGFPRDRAESTDQVADWTDDELLGLLSDLEQACDRRNLAGITGARGLRDALRGTGRSRSAIVAAQRKIARQLDAGERLRSPFGLLVRAAREGWPEYFPAESDQPRVEPAQTNDADTADAAVAELEETDDPYLAELDALVGQWTASIPGALRSRIESVPIDQGTRRHVDRVEAWRYLQAKGSTSVGLT